MGGIHQWATSRTIQSLYHTLPMCPQVSLILGQLTCSSAKPVKTQPFNSNQYFQSLDACYVKLDFCRMIIWRVFSSRKAFTQGERQCPSMHECLKVLRGAVVMYSMGCVFQMASLSTQTWFIWLFQAVKLFQTSWLYTQVQTVRRHSWEAGASLEVVCRWRRQAGLLSAPALRHWEGALGMTAQGLCGTIWYREVRLRLTFQEALAIAAY